MPVCHNFFRTIRLGVLIGLALSISNQLEAHPKNYTVIGANGLAFLFIFGVNLGPGRWFTLVLVAATVYFACMFADDATAAFGGSFVQGVNEMGEAAFRKFFAALKEAPPPQSTARSSKLREFSIFKKLWRAVANKAFPATANAVKFRARDAVRVVNAAPLRMRHGWWWLA